MKYCIYKFMDKYNKEIYIGKAKNLKSRLSSHNHLTDDCYNELAYIMYTSFKTENEMDFAERYYIQKINPKYNTVLSDKTISFSCKELDEKIFELYKSNDYVINNTLEQIELLKTEHLYLHINLNVLEFIGVMTLFSSQTYINLPKDNKRIKSLSEINRVKDELSANNVRVLLKDLKRKYFLLDMKINGSVASLIENMNFETNECIIYLYYKPKYETSYEKLNIILKLNK